MFRALRITVFVAIIGVALAGAAVATPPSGVAVATITATGTTTDAIHVANAGFVLNTRDVAVINRQTIIAQPGWSSGWHSHPGPTIVVVVRGTLSRYHGDCTRTESTAGQAFVEGDSHAGVVRNESAGEVELQVTYVTPRGVPLRTDGANPGCAVN
jgi:quercetin dioxygenase-like cupin family protein